METVIPDLIRDDGEEDVAGRPTDRLPPDVHPVGRRQI